MKSKFWVYGRLLLIAASLCLTAYNLWDEKRAGDSAEELLLQYQVLKFEIQDLELEEAADGMSAYWRFLLWALFCQ